MIAGTYLTSAVLLVVRRRPLQQRGVQRLGPDRGARGDLLLRLRRRELRLPDRQRDLPDGGQGTGDRVLLRDRNCDRRASPVRSSSRASPPQAIPGKVAIGYLIGAAVMAFGGIVELFLGIRAEGEQLEDVAAPLTAEAAEGDRGRRRAHRARADREAASGACRARADRPPALPARAGLGVLFAVLSLLGCAASRVDRCRGRPDRPRRRQRRRDRDASPGPRGQGRALGAGRFRAALREADRRGPDRQRIRAAIA